MASRGTMSFIPLFQQASLPPLNTSVALAKSTSASSIWAPVSPTAHDGNQWPNSPPLVSPNPKRVMPHVSRLDTGTDMEFGRSDIADGKVKAAIERSQHAVVEQLLRSLHMDSPEPLVDVVAPTPATTTARRWSPDPLSASSASSPSALPTPDNLSPLVMPGLDDYFATSPLTPAHNPSLPFLDRSHALPVTPPNVHQFDTSIGQHHTPTKDLRSSRSQAQIAQQELMLHAARTRSLSMQQPPPAFAPFAFPMPSPPTQNMLYRSHPLPQEQQQQQQQHSLPVEFAAPRTQFRHVSMPNARTPVSPTHDNWIRTSNNANAPPQPQNPVFQNPFLPHIIQHQQHQQASIGLHNLVSYQPPSASALHTVAPRTVGNEPINFLRLLQPSSQPPYDLFVQRIVRASDQQASIFLQQKLKVADAAERSKIVDAIAGGGFEMMTNRFGNWCCQRVWEYPEERRKLVECMKGRVVDIATNCYGTHVLQKALDCDDETRLVIVSELLHNDPATTLVNKHASHVFSKIMEINWQEPAPPIFSFFNNALRGKWASLACHETGSLVVQHVFENVEDEDPAKEEIVRELIAGFGNIVKNQFGAFCVQHLLEHGSSKHRDMALNQLMDGLLEYASNEQGVKSIQKALKEGGPDILDRICKRMCEPPQKGGRRALIVDLALNPTGSQLIASILPNVNKDQRTILYDAIRRHVVTLRGSKTGSKTVWLFDRMRAYYGFGPSN
ncbi:ARM repeat-containing protein [Auriculariales sp. MPI-PUGE-AT-0066]|nr:ARM repeat-containing protein [Auriculariales sp. MPI-PUGE-AT-0066]